MPDMYLDVDAALSEVPVNLMPLIDDTDFKTRETAIVYNQAGMDLVWNFVTSAGAFTQTAVTPTTAGNYDWTNQGDGMYSIEIPASGGASINNDTEGYGWFTGFCTGVLPWRGPVIGFRASGLNDLMLDSAYSTTRGLSGTALPNAAADAAGGLPISDAGGLDLDAKLANTNEVTVARMGALTDWLDGGRLDLILDARSSQTSVDTIDGIVDAILIDTAEIGAAGAGLTAIPWNAAWDAEVQSEVTDGLTAFWTSPATLVDLVWDEPTAGHTTAGTTGKALTDAGSAGDPWSTALPGAYGAGTAGKILGDNLNAPVGTIDAVVDAIKVTTDKFVFTVANQVDANMLSMGGTTQTAGNLVTLIGNVQKATVQKNVAFSDFEFPMRLSSDHYTAATGKTVTGERSIDGGAFAAVAGTIAEVGDGVYQFDAAQADTNGDSITWKFSAAACDDTIVTFKTST